MCTANWEVFVLYLGGLNFVVCTDVLWVQSGDTKLLLFAQVNVSLVYSPCVAFDGKLRWQVEKCRQKRRNNRGIVIKQRWQRLNRTHVSNTAPKDCHCGLKGSHGSRTPHGFRKVMILTRCWKKEKSLHFKDTMLAAELCQQPNVNVSSPPSHKHTHTHTHHTLFFMYTNILIIYRPILISLYQRRSFMTLLSSW